MPLLLIRSLFLRIFSVGCRLEMRAGIRLLNRRGSDLLSGILPPFCFSIHAKKEDAYKIGSPKTVQLADDSSS